MKRFLLFIITFLTCNLIYSQSEACDPSIPSLCDPGPFPASTSDLDPTAPVGTDYGCLWTVESPSFFYFEAGSSGALSIDITPVDINGTQLTNDLDFICWGPFNNLSNVCNQLTTLNIADCDYSGAWPNSIETVNIASVIAGNIYVILVTNYQFGGGGNPCFIDFNPSSPFSCCSFAGSNNTMNVCTNDPSFDLITGLNGQPDTIGSWINQSGNIINSVFSPSSDTGGIYNYIIDSTSICPSDTAWLTINLLNAVNVSITSDSNVCSNNPPLILTTNISGGTFSGNNVIDSIFTPDVSVIGSNPISYIYAAANGCSDTAFQNMIVYDSPTILTINEIYNHPACFGDTNGNISITPTGGTPGYSYLWNNVQGGSTMINLSAGIYTYIVTDTNTCSYTNTIALNNPNNNIGTLTAYNSSCYNQNDGAIDVNITGSTTPPGTVSTLGYCLSSPNTVEFAAMASSIIETVILNGNNVDINNSTIGTPDFYQDYTSIHYADITENQSYTISVTLNGLGAPGSSNNLASGKVFIDFNIDGDFDDLGEEIGIIPYGPNTSVNLPFTVPVTNIYGPTRMRVVSQKQPNTNLIGPCDYADPSIPYSSPWFGATEDYSIVLSAPIVTATFSWNNGDTTDSISNLGPGEYIVTITPSNGCSVQDTAEIFEPEQIILNTTVTEISCNSMTDGQITLSPAGGNGGPYAIDWGSITNPSSVGSGTYTITVSDSSTITADNTVACTHDTTIIMLEPEYFNVDFTTSSNKLCSNDTLTLNFDFNQGGIPDFMINYTHNGIPLVAGPFSSGLHQINATPNIGNNTYIITSIIDDIGCSNQNTISLQDVYVNPSPDINITIAPNPICEGDNATLLFSAPTGTSPYVIDYFSGETTTSINITGAGGNLPVSPSSTTTYTLNFVTDNEGCTANLTDSTTLIVNELPEMTFTSPTEFCDGDVIQLKFNFTAGAAPWMVNYDVSGGGNSTVAINNAIDSIAISPSATTTYTINSVTDNNNCTNNIAQTVVINSNPLPEAVLSGGGIICGDGSTTDIIFTSSSGTPPYNLTYSAGVNSNFAANVGVIHTVTTDQNGIYTIESITDSKGCNGINITGVVNVSVNPVPQANIIAFPQTTDIINPLITFIDASSGHITGQWDFADGNTEISNLGQLNYTYNDTGTYQVSLNIESDSGCVSVAYQTIIISPVFRIYIPNSFTPNNDLNNDYFLPIVDGVSEYEFSIYDRLGERIFSTNRIDVAWDGKVNNSNEHATKGVYIYALVITDINGKLRTYEGPVTLIR